MKLEKHTVQVPVYWPRLEINKRQIARWLLPTPGNVLFTLLVVAGLLWASSAGALPLGAALTSSTSTSTIAYQGRLADADGNPLTDTYNMIFRLYEAASGGVPLWEEQWTGSNGVQVSDGLFNVMLGSLTAIPQSVITGNDTLFLGITVGTDDEMTPRVQLGSVPFAVQALTVPDGSVTTAKIADEAVTQAKLDPTISFEPPDGSITTQKIVGGAVTAAKLNVDDVLHVTPPGVGGIRLTNRSSGGGDWVIYTGDNGCFGGNRLGLGPIVPPGSGHCGGDLGTAIILGPDGSFTAIGTKSSLVHTDDGMRKLYAVESPEVRFSDEGKARLVDGVARVDLDPVFVETIEGEYLVHVTPYGDASLYVAEIGINYFVVRARDGNPDVACAWRLSAHRKGYAGVRLERVEEVSLMQ